jgi:hypothetical protein
MDKIEYKRIKYEHQGRVVYEWEQSLEEIHCYIAPPPGIAARQFDIHIAAKHLRVGIKGNPPFLDVRARPQLPIAPAILRLLTRGVFSQLARLSRGRYIPSFLSKRARLPRRARIAVGSRALLIARARAAPRVACRRISWAQ